MSMPSVVLATTNGGKRAEFQLALGDVVKDVQALPIGLSMPEETGLTFVDNALLKARYVCSTLKLPCLADDSGLVVPAIGGEPGLFSARYAGPHATDLENIECLLSNMKDIPHERRSAYFFTALAWVWPDGKEVIATGQCDGKILFAPVGKGGFGYDSIFLYEMWGLTFAQMRAEQKNAVSHRTRALSALLAQLQ